MAEGQYLHIGAENFAFGKSGVAQASVWSVSYNQAATSFLKDRFNAGIYYENMFFIKELSLKSIVFNWNSENYGSFGLVVNSFGFSEFNKNKLAFSYSMKLSENFSAGISIDYLFIHQNQAYGNIGLMTGEIGLLYYPFDKLSVGVHIFNPWHSKIKISPNEYLPTIFELGLCYRPLDNVIFNSSITKDIEQPIELNGGIGYMLINNLWLRTGFKLIQKDYFIGAGIGYRYKYITLDLGFENHPLLGMKSAVSVSVSF